MSLTLELTPVLERRLKAVAARLGLPLAEYALRTLEAALTPDGMPANGAELVAYWEQEGVLGIWADRADIKDSSEYAGKLRRRAERRTRR
jgi:hypothetical protein